MGANPLTAPVTLLDPTHLYRPARLDCGRGGIAAVDLTERAPVAAPEDALVDLLSEVALGDHDVEAAGYPAADPRPYVVRQGGRTVAVAGFSARPGGLALVELHACSDALVRGG